MALDYGSQNVCQDYVIVLDAGKKVQNAHHRHGEEGFLDEVTD